MFRPGIGIRALRMSGRWGTHMVRSSWLRHAAVLGALTFAVTVFASAGPVRAQDDGTIENENSIWNLERRLWSGIAHGLGLRSADDPVIEYRERSPLVVPPTRDLPQPKTKSAAKNPSWPQDPDHARRNQRSAAQKRAGANDLSRVLDRQSGAISPDQLNVPGGTVAPSGPPRGDISGDGKPVNPSELGYFGGLFTSRAWGFGGYRDEVGTFNKEPSREALTAPPSGYQTPSSEHPYGTNRRIERTAPKQLDPAAGM
jgi:hypothetical protein